MSSLLIMKCWELLDCVVYVLSFGAWTLGWCFIGLSKGLDAGTCSFRCDANRNGPTSISPSDVLRVPDGPGLLDLAPICVPFVFLAAMAEGVRCATGGTGGAAGQRADVGLPVFISSACFSGSREGQ